MHGGAALGGLTGNISAETTSELAELFGDETHLYAETHDDDLAGLAMSVFVTKHLGYGS